MKCTRHKKLRTLPLPAVYPQ